ncbi:hypothetical protein [Breoghania sp.]|uniref:hypothetical protein n=1 Tax=Breoghania sp. TaxID=2065378 RepID=UPI002610A801|nr:hypothetical protein [Breoghania sp.]MDJ0931417.1 hypothetical protein [Breoghania sp.]
MILCLPYRKAIFGSDVPSPAQHVGIASRLALLVSLNCKKQTTKIRPTTRVIELSGKGRTGRDGVGFLEFLSVVITQRNPGNPTGGQSMRGVLDPPNFAGG